ncbi:SDR family NAD(P)-dependent oxidoreductase [Lelliottia sp. CFBP8978]|jgi:3-oxoacyl-[acyl-carrier protein] reductase|uniref:SDR family NAD(P)-dependent oxidoreductase n=1 Tax=Lelliottia sp. CFBP8978 TaxID=3096522 RepID=UPI002A6B58A1|nr:SDR family NAD(P)-dependent oxidoreductase [Lelliottia sp. CFBP8978]MDY1038785.1 SDR family NAD(P)-dependent oxidoreductase [Lelliottia sp. CFBP8978]
MLMQGKTVLITGCRRGMGFAMVEVFAANGANIYAHAREADEAFIEQMAAIAKRHQVEIWPVCFDMTDYDAMKLAIKKIMSDKRPLDAVINNAGITLNSLFQMTSEAQLRAQFEVNFFAVYLFSQYIAKMMVRHQRGSIINIASTAGEDGNPGKSAYGASKAALIAMTKSIAAELGEKGIRANCIAPGITDTDMLLTMPEHIVEAAKNSADLRRAGTPAEIAEAALFLASDLSAYITGQTIRVDGGLK